MATNAQQKPGLTTFGWLALGATAAAILANSTRREKILGGARDFLDKCVPARSDATAPSAEHP